MKVFLFLLLVFAAIIGPNASFAQTIDQVKKFKSTTPPPAPVDAVKSSPQPAVSTPAPAVNEAAEINRLLNKPETNEQPFNFLLNPMVQKIAKFLSDKKVVAALNTFSQKENMTKMLKSQLVLMLAMIMLRAWMSPKTKTFMAGFVANLWLTALYLFVSLLVLPNFIYGPGYLEFVKAAYAFSKEFTG